MGAVHGVYLKYVGLSALSYAGYAWAVGGHASTASAPVDGAIFAQGFRTLATSAPIGDASMLRLGAAAVFGYSAVLNGSIAIMFKMRRGMSLLGKDRRTGSIPSWSYLIFFPFHIPTMIYTHIHTRKGSYKATNPAGETRREPVPVASEVQPGWWVGGCYAHELNRDWAGIVDLTVEFPERCIDRSGSYLLVPTWDGVPATPAQLEEAATFAAEAHRHGDVIIHCAHGRGRSTTVMCAALVRAGLYKTWQQAFEEGIKPGRPVCKLNSKMRQALSEWQRDYVDGKKAT